jgi:hypothetical protein
MTAPRGPGDEGYELEEEALGDFVQFQN